MNAIVGNILGATPATPAAFDVEAFAAANGLSVYKHNFQEIKPTKNNKLGRPKLESVSIAIPTIDGAGLFNTLADPALDKEKQGKLLGYLADLHNTTVFNGAKKQITEALATMTNDAAVAAAKLPEWAQSVLTIPGKLDLWSLVMAEKGRRIGYLPSKELFAAALISFKEHRALYVGKTGAPLSDNGFINYYIEAFDNKLKNIKASANTKDQNALNVATANAAALNNNLILWYGALDDAGKATHERVAEYLFEELATILKPDTSMNEIEFE